MLYLVQYKTNYADEFDVYGFSIWDRERLVEFNKTCDKVRKNSDLPINHYFGTNEEIEFDSPQHLFSAFTVTELHEFEAQVLLNSFKMQVNSSKGLFFELADRVSDWENENEYNEE